MVSKNIEFFVILNFRLLDATKVSKFKTQKQKTCHF